VNVADGAVGFHGTIACRGGSVRDDYDDSRMAQNFVACDREQELVVAAEPA
jgi:hypothetical protein